MNQQRTGKANNLVSRHFYLMSSGQHTGRKEKETQDRGRRTYLQLKKDPKVPIESHEVILVSGEAGRH